MIHTVSLANCNSVIRLLVEQLIAHHQLPLEYYIHPESPVNNVSFHLRNSRMRTVGGRKCQDALFNISIVGNAVKIHYCLDDERMMFTKSFVYDLCDPNVFDINKVVIDIRKIIKEYNPRFKFNNINLFTDG